MAKKKDTELSQTRLDWWADGIDYETSPAEKTAEGFLIARAPLTSVGVFTYRNADGTPRRELRLPEEVFSEESLATLKLKPLTLLQNLPPPCPCGAWASTSACRACMPTTNFPTLVCIILDFIDILLHNIR